jgi:hypothetical protein
VITRLDYRGQWLDVSCPLKDLNMSFMRVCLYPTILSVWKLMSVPNPLGVVGVLTAFNFPVSPTPSIPISKADFAGRSIRVEFLYSIRSW